MKQEATTNHMENLYGLFYLMNSGKINLLLSFFTSSTYNKNFNYNIHYIIYLTILYVIKTMNIQQQTILLKLELHRRTTTNTLVLALWIRIRIRQKNIYFREKILSFRYRCILVGEIQENPVKEHIKNIAENKINVDVS